MCNGEFIICHHESVVVYVNKMLRRIARDGIAHNGQHFIELIFFCIPQRHLGVVCSKCTLILLLGSALRKGIK